MDETTTALARRWRVAPGFRWYRGMSFTSKLGRGTITDMSLFVANYAHHITTLPDLDDPLTRGAALVMARAAWGDPAIRTQRASDGSWIVWRTKGLWVEVAAAYGPTELEALIAALEAAPEVAQCPPTT